MAISTTAIALEQAGNAIKRRESTSAAVEFLTGKLDAFASVEDRVHLRIVAAVMLEFDQRWADAARLLDAASPDRDDPRLQLHLAHVLWAIDGEPTRALGEATKVLSSVLRHRACALLVTLYAAAENWIAAEENLRELLENHADAISSLPWIDDAVLERMADFGGAATTVARFKNARAERDVPP
jgi:hypothetical protein